MKKIFLVLFFSLSVTYLFAQQLYMPIEFKNAYKKGTRKMDGTVSETYRQNRASYKLKAKIDPATKLLKGEGDIVYTNNRTDTLYNFVFHTYHDFYRNESERMGFFNPKFGERPVTSGVNISKCVINGESIDLKNDQNVNWGGTYYSMRLKKPLLPNASLTMQINWEYTIPGKGFERSGAIDNTSMFVAYWYPEVAVCDDIDGWDRTLYNAATEFYHDYSDYEVEVEAPNNYLVWASVAPTNASEIYPAEMLKKIEDAKKSETKVSIVTEEDLKKGLKMKVNVWKYSAKNFPDFSFAVSDDFLWDARTYKDKFGEYFLNAAYPAESKEFGTMLKQEAESIKKFHTEFPIYEFPYHHFTVFNGLEGGGMEFPGMANDENYSAAGFEPYIGRKITEDEIYRINFGLTIHEMGHMYFPFLMGINEKKYAWMDEGMASYTEFFIGESIFKYDGDNPNLGNQRIAPMMTLTHSNKFSGTNSYDIGAASYHALSNLLGKELFDKCLKTYIDRWKYKHPTPYDYFFTFNSASGVDLNWFWKAWYFDWGYLDVAIESYKNGVLTIKNEGGRPMPFTIEYTTKDGKKMTENVSTKVWKDKTTYEHKLKGDIVSITLITKTEALKTNNTWISK